MAASEDKSPHYSRAFVPCLPRRGETSMMERETGFEPATNSLEGCDSTPELLPLWWRWMDLNHRRLSPADLQSAAIDRSATPP